MTQLMLEIEADQLLKELLQPQCAQQLEQYRFYGSTNKVYHIPLDEAGREFIVVKLLPGSWVNLRMRMKRFIRNRMYGEHDVSAGGERVQMEKERNREWQREGFSTPPLVETNIPGVRVFKGLPYPTFFTILSDPTVAIEEKLRVLAAITRDLSNQHKIARQREKQSLVHRDPGPWNVMFDPVTRVPFWFDLEFPAEIPRMTMDELMVRAVRIYLFGVLDHLDDHFDATLETFVENYESEAVLWKFVETMERPGTYLLRRTLEKVRGRTRSSYLRRRSIAPKIREYLTRKDHSRVGTTGVSANPGGEL